MNLKNKIKNLSSSWYFPLAMSGIYIAFFFFKNDIFYVIINHLIQILTEVLPVFFIIFLLMTLSDYFISPEFILKHTGKGRKRKWLFAIVGGILSTGPVYMWYPLLADLKGKVLDEGMVACFLYNRAIKIPLLPIAVLYFSLSYILILCFIMIIASILQGFIINKIIK